MFWDMLFLLLYPRLRNDVVVVVVHAMAVFLSGEEIWNQRIG
jgi:hypothetical protein